MGTQIVNFEALSLGSYSEPTKREFGVGATNLVTFGHNFRVTCASGNIFELVSKLLGHKSVKTTHRYAEVLLDRKIEAVNRMTNLF